MAKSKRSSRPNSGKNFSGKPSRKGSDRPPRRSSERPEGASAARSSEQSPSKKTFKGRGPVGKPIGRRPSKSSSSRDRGDRHDKDLSPGFMLGPQRLNKVLAAAGLGSRRQVDELIEQGRVEIDGETCTEFHRKVDPAVAKIEVDGQSLRKQKAVYFAVNKPAGFLCTNRDPEGRSRVIDLVPDSARLFPVGRLDRSSVGLILLTNDGELAQRLAHPKYGVPKSYFVVVQGQIAADQLNRLRRGIYLAEGVARVEGAKIRRVRKGCTELDITLTEGKNREIRRVLARLGHKVVVLRRVAIGPLRLSDMPEGAHRPLHPTEVDALYSAAEQARRDRLLAKKEREERHKQVAAERAEKMAKRKAEGREVPSDLEEGSKSKRKGDSLRGKKDKPSRRIDDDDLLIGGFIEDDFSGEDFDDGEDFGSGDGSQFHDEPETGVVRSGMIEVSPIWNEDAPVSSRRGGVIDYELDDSELAKFPSEEGDDGQTFQEEQRGDSPYGRRDRRGSRAEGGARGGDARKPRGGRPGSFRKGARGGSEGGESSTESTSSDRPFRKRTKIGPKGGKRVGKPSGKPGSTSRLSAERKMSQPKKFGGSKGPSKGAGGKGKRPRGKR